MRICQRPDRSDTVCSHRKMDRACSKRVTQTARIESYELAFRMQTAVPGLMDLTRESKATLATYGIDDRTTETVDALRQAVQALKGTSPWRISFLRDGRRRQVSLVPSNG